MIPAIYADQFLRDPVAFASGIIAVVLSIVLHELGHGIAAIWQGDDTPRITGHMTLNPLVHIPPVGWLLLLLAGITYGLMPVNPQRFRSRYGNALVAAAGPAVNLLLALVSLTALGLWLRLAGLAESGAGETAQDFLFQLGALNLILVALNLLPIPPLDGSTVLADFVPAFRRLARNPSNQPIFMGAFILCIVFSDRIWTATYSIVRSYVGLVWGA